MAAVIPWHGDKSRNLTSLVFVFWASAVNWAVLAAFRPTRRSCSPTPVRILPSALDLTVYVNSGWTVNEIPSTRSAHNMPSTPFPVAAADRGHRLRAAAGRLLSGAGVE